MKKIYTTILFFLLGQLAFAQVPYPIWATSAGGMQDDNAEAVAVDASGNVYSTGAFRGTAYFGATTLNSIGFRNVFLSKYNNKGNLIWTKQTTGPTSERARAIAVDAAGNSYITGYFYNTIVLDGITLTATGGGNTYDIFVAKYNTNGNCVWAVNAGGTGSDDETFGIALDASNNIYITGIFSSTISIGAVTKTGIGNDDIFVAKLNNTGVCQWIKTAGGTDDDYAASIAVDASNNIVITGNFRNTATFGTFSLSSNGFKDIFVAKYNSSGTEQWAKKIGGASSDEGQAVAIDYNNNIIVSGIFNGTVNFGGAIFTSTNDISNNPTDDIFIAKYNSSGIFSWVEQAAGIRDHNAAGLAIDSDNGIYLTGAMSGDLFLDLGTYKVSNSSYGPTFSYDDAFLIHYNSTGAFQWGKKGGDGYNDKGYGVCVDADDNIFIAGQLNETGSADFDHTLFTPIPNSDNNDAFLVKYQNQKKIPHTKVDIDCYNNNNGSIDLAPNFGTAPYTFNWSTGAISEDINNLAEGTYNVTVTDALLNTASTSIIINNPLQFRLVANKMDAAGCGIANGFVWVYPEGGTPSDSLAPFIYDWSHDPTEHSSNEGQLLPGSYTITATDANSCIDIQTVVVEPNPADKDILTFSVPNQLGVSIIDYVNHTVYAEVTIGTNLSNLAPTFTLSDCAIINPASGLAQDFSLGAITYTTTAFDNSTQLWSVQVVDPTLLPVDLTALRGNKKSRQENLLQWATAQEVNSDLFYIERSFDGISFEIIGRVNAVGNSVQEQHYHYTDIDAATLGLCYYRLKSVDQNSDEQYSNTISIRGNSNTSSLLNIYPNPFEETINVFLELEENSSVSIKIISAVGQTLFQKIVDGNIGKNNYPLDLKNLLQGVYILEVEINQNKRSQKIVKQ